VSKHDRIYLEFIKCVSIGIWNCYYELLEIYWALSFKFVYLYLLAIKSICWLIVLYQIFRSLEHLTDMICKEMGLLFLFCFIFRCFNNIGYDADIQKSVRKTTHGLRLTREIVVSIASKAVSIGY